MAGSPNPTFPCRWLVTSTAHPSGLHPLPRSSKETPPDTPHHLLLTPAKLPSDTLLQKRLVSPATVVVRGREGKNVILVKASGRPRSPTNVNIRVLVKVVERLAKIRLARGVVGSAAGFGK